MNIIYGTIQADNGRFICPICGVGSNLYPDYLTSEGTAVIQRLSYCDHKAEGYHKVKNERRPL